MKIFCYGDSNTYGFDPVDLYEGRYPETNCWTSCLATMLNCEVVNEGMNGRRILQTDMEYTYLDKRLDEERPDHLVVMLGTNDVLFGRSLFQISRSMNRLLRHIKELPADLAVVVIAPVGVTIPERPDLEERSKELASLYQDIADEAGVLFADAGLWDIPIAYDGVHFTEEGHGRFAVKLAEVLSKELAEEVL